jgi:ketosteroid isomerase-like protein
MTTGPASDRLDRLIDALNAHDAGAVGELMSADVEYVCWSDSEWKHVHGREPVVALIESFDHDLSSDFVLVPTFKVVAADRFAVEYDETGTQDRGPSPSGRRFSLHNVMVGELRDGQICRLTDYSDVVAFRNQTRTGAT